MSATPETPSSLVDLRINQINEVVTGFDRITPLGLDPIQLGNGESLTFQRTEVPHQGSIILVEHSMYVLVGLTPGGEPEENLLVDKYLIRDHPGGPMISFDSYPKQDEDDVLGQIMDLAVSHKNGSFAEVYERPEAAESEFREKRDRLKAKADDLKNKRLTALPDEVLGDDEQITTARRLAKILRGARLHQIVALAQAEHDSRG